MTLGDATNNGGLTFSGGTSIGASGADLTVLGNTSMVMSGALTGTGNLIVRGGFGLFFTGQTGNNWSGALTVNGANVYAGNPNSGVCTQFEASTNPITLTAGQFFYLGSTAAIITKTHTGGGLLSISNSGGVTFNTGTMSGLTGTVQTFTDNTTGASSLARFANWPTAAGSVNSFSASSSSGTHTLEYNGSASIGPLSQNWSRYATSGAQTMTFQHYGTGGATFALSGSVTHQSATNTIGLQFDVNNTAGLLTLSGSITQASTGVFNVIKLGVGAMTLSGANTFTGSVTVSDGTLNANSATALGAASSTAGISVTSGATLSLGGASNITYTAPRTLTLAGTGVSPGTPGALVIANTVTNTFSGIVLTAGTLVRASESGTLTSPVTTNNHNLTFTVAAGKTLTLPSTSVISASTSTVSYNTVSGDTGTAVVSAQNLYTNPTVISQGTVRVGASYVGSPGSVTSGPLGRGQLTWNGGALDALTTTTLGNNVILGGDVSFGGTAALTLAGTVSLGANRTITTNGSGGALTLSGVISGATFKLTKAGTNTLTLTNANTYTGGTDIGAGTLKCNHVNALNTTGTVTLTSSSATLQTATSGQVNQNGKITVAALNNAAGGIIKIGG